MTPSRPGASVRPEPTPAEVEAYHELCGYTLSLGDAEFIHQYVVDVWALQRARPDGKPVSVAFALAGLFLYLESGFTGRQVQRIHMLLARQSRTWPTFTLPEARGSLTALDVMATAPGQPRSAAIHAWCTSVWQAYAASHAAVRALLERHGITHARSTSR